MAAQKADELRARTHRLGKTIAAVRFAMRHAGTGRAGAPARALTKERRKEMEDRIAALEAERAEIRKRLSNAKDEKQTAGVVGLALVESQKAED